MTSLVAVLNIPFKIAGFENPLISLLTVTSSFQIYTPFGKGAYFQ